MCTAFGSKTISILQYFYNFHIQVPYYNGALSMLVVPQFEWLLNIHYLVFKKRDII